MKIIDDPRPTRWKATVDDTEMLTAMGVPGRLAVQAVTLDPFPLPKQAQTWLDNLDHIHKPEGPPDPSTVDLYGVGLLLYGQSGVGKSVMAVQILRDILRSDRVDWKNDSRKTRLLFSICGRFFDWQELSEHLREQFDDDSGGEWPSIRASLEGAVLQADDGQRGPFWGGGVVVLDDLSRERSTDFNHDRLHYYLRKRVNNGLLTIVTTNLYPGEWDDAYGDVLGSFLHRAFISAEV